MNMMMNPITPQAEQFLEDLAEELDIPEHRYDDAKTSYESLGNWLKRDESSVRQFDPHIYVQGSFRLGTAIRPRDDEEEYDVDSVCEFRLLTKSQLSQAELKRRLGVEIRAYARSQNMVKPVREGRRCWILDYADGAQFHMDVVPALPNGLSQRLLLERHNLAAPWASTAIVITDNEVPNYHLTADDWPRSNPKGYAEWFKSRMAAIFEERRRRKADGMRASVESIPDYKVRTPLQSAVMILKRHRDEMFAGRPDERPISVILTTLAAHSYNGEGTIGSALVSILGRMHEFVGHDGEKYVIPNPTDPLENFADKWVDHPERADAFREWLGQAREDFARAAALSNRQVITETLARGIGRGLAERANTRPQRTLGKPAILTSGLIRSEAEARRKAVRLEGGGQNA
jgi:hypothetical protein